MNNSASPLQMLDWRIGRLSVDTNIIVPSEDTPHNWTIKADLQHLDSVGTQLRAALFVEFDFSMEQDENKNEINGIAAAYFTFDKEKINNNDPQALFDQLLHRAAMTNMFGNLRVFLLQLGTLLQISSKRLMLPFINLNEFKFGEEYTYTV